MTDKRSKSSPEEEGAKIYKLSAGFPESVPETPQQFQQRLNIFAADLVAFEASVMAREAPTAVTVTGLESLGKKAAFKIKKATAEPASASTVMPFSPATDSGKAGKGE